MKFRTGVIGVVILAAIQSVAGADQPPPLRTEFAFEARVRVDKPIVIGESSHGLRRIVPILGGPVQGPALRGNVIAGGADWQYVRPDGAWELEAKYTVQTDDGVLIMVENRGVRYGKPEVMERLAKGEKVDADLIYCRTVASFEAPRGSKYEWMNHTLFVGSVERLPDAAIVRFYRVE
jgi:hypothetical protein